MMNESVNFIQGTYNRSVGINLEKCMGHWGRNDTRFCKLTLQ